MSVPPTGWCRHFSLYARFVAVGVPPARSREAAESLGENPVGCPPFEGVTPPLTPLRSLSTFLGSASLSLPRGCSCRHSFCIPWRCSDSSLRWRSSFCWCLCSSIAIARAIRTAVRPIVGYGTDPRASQRRSVWQAQACIHQPQRDIHFGPPLGQGMANQFLGLVEPVAHGVAVDV